ncbi:hypothetical protein [Cognatiyoonia sp. IB215182]|uniref:hypothetical protein n=1 Tax=Cognatiyoonia sp. IB215182 TaxID=3097353 RepID=UPI002A17148E|nr:hypothetical protein [Cognatiyoonia sp. IB215182]MDX8352050.1 hypothetical protein [Cognatiyoonia sp. IB215182]
MTDTAASPSVTVTPLDRPSKDPVGLLPPEVTGLPRTIWANSDEATLVDLVRAERVETLPAMQDFLRVLMLAEADAPFDADAEGALFLARVDKLLDLGALEPAQSLIEQADPDTIALFRRWFDVALLTGTEDRVCDVMRANASVAPTYPARIFCLARNGDWPAAALTLNTNRVLGDISEAEEALLSRFLDPELFEGEPPLAPPARVSPLTFRMHEAIGEPLITATLPLAFAHADLRPTTAWKSQLEAAERLARHGSVAENTLQKFYTARIPAASGGVWDRAAAIQRFDAALRDRDTARLRETLPAAWQAMQDARTEVPFAKLYADDLQDLPLEGQAAEIAFYIGLLSPGYEEVALAAQEVGLGFDPFLVALARGVPQEVPARTTEEIAIQAAFNGAAPSAAIEALVGEGKLGEALLRAIAQFNAGYVGDSRLVTDALALLRSVGVEDVARRAALQMLILDRTP